MVCKVPENLFFLFRFQIFLFEDLNVANEHFRGEFLFVLNGFSK